MVGGALMFATGIVEVFLGVDAEQMSLEDIATPVSAQGLEGVRSQDNRPVEREGSAARLSTGDAQSGVGSQGSPPLPAVERARLPRWCGRPFPRRRTSPARTLIGGSRSNEL